MYAGGPGPLAGLLDQSTFILCHHAKRVKADKYRWQNNQSEVYINLHELLAGGSGIVSPFDSSSSSCQTFFLRFDR
jgi:hypothetical protein